MRQTDTLSLSKEVASGIDITTIRNMLGHAVLYNVMAATMASNEASNRGYHRSVHGSHGKSGITVLTIVQSMQSTVMESRTESKPFLTDVLTLRARAREHLETGNVTFSYIGDANKTVEILQSVLATEIVCVLRYTMHAVAAAGISSEDVKKEFQEHADEELQHVHEVAERINQLGGRPNFNPEGLASRSASEYGSANTLINMIEENLIAERIAVDHYRELIRYFGENDPATKSMLTQILRVEEEHANDMHDLLVAHQGKPPLDK